jgi:hypothetical protein
MKLTYVIVDYIFYSLSVLLSSCIQCVLVLVYVARAWVIEPKKCISHFLQ